MQKQWLQAPREEVLCLEPLKDEQFPWRAQEVLALRDHQPHRCSSRQVNPGLLGTALGKRLEPVPQEGAEDQELLQFPLPNPGQEYEASATRPHRKSVHPFGVFAGAAAIFEARELPPDRLSPDRVLFLGC